MKAKLFNLLSFSLISLILFTSLASAATFTISPSTLSFDSSNSKTFVISNPVATPLNVAFDSTISITGEDGYTITFDVTGVKTGITNTTPSTITVDPQTTIDFSKFNLGESYSSNLVINSGTDSKTIKIEIVSNDFCEFSNEGDLDLTIDDITVKGINGKIFSNDDNEWFPLDVVEIDIKVENNGNENVKNVEVEWCLFDNENKKCVLDDNENDFKLNDGDDNTIIVKLTVDPDKLEKDVTDYTFFARATGKIDGGDLKGEKSCASNSEDVEVMLESDFVVIDNIQFDELNECGSEAVISANVWNIGDSDQNNVVARVFIDELKINKDNINIGDINSFDKEKLSTLITIPADAAEKTYTLQLWVLDDNGDIYESSNNDEVKYDFPFVVKGNCKPIITETEAEIIFDPLTAIQSGGKAGKQLVLQAKIANSGTERKDFIISVLGLDSWATIESIEPSSVSLNPSASENILITLNVNSDVEGDQEFTISVKSGSLTSKSKTVKVPIEKSSGGFKFPGITGGVTGIISGDNWYLWGIGILNVILVIIIIIVAVRVARS